MTLRDELLAANPYMVDEGHNDIHGTYREGVDAALAGVVKLLREEAEAVMNEPRIASFMALRRAADLIERKQT